MFKDELRRLGYPKPYAQGLAKGLRKIDIADAIPKYLIQNHSSLIEAPDGYTYKEIFKRMSTDIPYLHALYSKLRHVNISQKNSEDILLAHTDEMYHSDTEDIECHFDGQVYKNTGEFIESLIAKKKTKPSRKLR